MIEVSSSAASPEGAELSVERLSLVIIKFLTFTNFHQCLTLVVTLLTPYLLLWIERFWKESLLLSSLHHPNVLSFYWIVRDGPDGSLATFADFMVNGSLKQFLQKKHRYTIHIFMHHVIFSYRGLKYLTSHWLTPPEQLIVAKNSSISMDSAFGVEYLATWKEHSSF